MGKGRILVRGEKYLRAVAGMKERCFGVFGVVDKQKDKALEDRVDHVARISFDLCFFLHERGSKMFSSK